MDLVDVMKDITLTLITLAWLKSFIIGSEFSFYTWKKYGKEYTKWYFNERPKFKSKREE